MLTKDRFMKRCRCWLVPALAFQVLFSTFDAKAQGSIVYVHLPPTEPEIFPYDAEGLRMWSGVPMSYALVFSGQVTFTVNSRHNFSITPASSNAVLALHPGPFDLGGFVIPLHDGQVIGPDALGYEWVNDTEIASGVGSSFMACRDIGCIGYFTGLESGYAGLKFQQNGQAYYGWVRVGAPAIGINGGWLYDYAYETRPNTPILAGAGKDSDHDGVWDYLDLCPNTPPGAVVDTNGCSICQLCPCEGPWKNHGEYVKAVESVSARFVQEGLITEQQRAAIVKQAANSDCGKHR